MKIRKNDKVKIISGKDAGKMGTVLKALPKDNKIVVEGINLVKKHVKPGKVSKEGGIISIERPIDVSNAMYYSEKDQRPVRLGFMIIDGKKYRINKKTKEVLDQKVK